MAKGRRAEARKVKLLGHTDLGGWGNTSQIQVKGRYAFVASVGEGSPEGTTVVNVADPRRPKVVTQIPAPRGTHSHKVRLYGDLMYVNNERLKGAGAEFIPGVRIYDIRKPAAPKLLATYRTGGDGVHRFGLDAERGLLLLTTGDEEFTDRPIWICDLKKDPLKPKLIGKAWFPGQWKAGGEDPGRLPPGRVASHGPPIIRAGRMYCAFWDAGIAIFDVSELARPKYLSHLDWSPPFVGATHTFAPVADKPFAVVTDEGRGSQNFPRSQFLWVVDITADTNPIPIATYIPPVERYINRGGRFGAHNIVEEIPDDLVFVTWFNAGMRVLDISNPHRPEEVGYYVPAADFGKPAPQTNDICRDARGRLYIADRWGGGMHILEHTG